MFQVISGNGLIWIIFYYLVFPLDVYFFILVLTSFLQYARQIQQPSERGRAMGCINLCAVLDVKPCQLITDSKGGTYTLPKTLTHSFLFKSQVVFKK